LRGQEEEQREAMTVATYTPSVVPKFMSTVKFILDNELHIFENSSLKALEMMGRMKVDMQDIETETCEVCLETLEEMMKLMMRNSKTILTSTLPGVKKL
jgi:hypothetical protein